MLIRALCSLALVALVVPAAATETISNVVIDAGAYDFMLRLPPERFSLDEQKDYETASFYWVDDVEDIAGLHVVIWRWNQEEARQPTPRAWAEDALDKLSDKVKGAWYHEGKKAEEDKNKRSISPVELGTGEEAIQIRSEVRVNGHPRQVAFTAFERVIGNDRFWYLIAAVNTAKYADLSEALALVRQGVGRVSNAVSAVNP